MPTITVPSTEPTTGAVTPAAPVPSVEQLIRAISESPTFQFVTSAGTSSYGGLGANWWLDANGRAYNYAFTTSASSTLLVMPQTWVSQWPLVLPAAAWQSGLEGTFAQWPPVAPPLPPRRATPPRDPQRPPAGVSAEAAERAAREHLEAQQREQAEAEARARMLLLEHLDPAQRRSFRANGAFVVRTPSGRRYRVRHGVAGNIDELDGRGLSLARYCIHPSWSHDLPVPDVLLAQLLLLQTDEEAFLRIANRSPRAARPRAEALA